MQIVLYNLPDFLDDFIPYYTGGIRKGALTPAGRMFRYNINGLQVHKQLESAFKLNKHLN